MIRRPPRSTLFPYTPFFLPARHDDEIGPLIVARRSRGRGRGRGPHRLGDRFRFSPGKPLTEGTESQSSSARREPVASEEGPAVPSASAHHPAIRARIAGSVVFLQEGRVPKPPDQRGLVRSELREYLVQVTPRFVDHLP